MQVVDERWYLYATHFWEPRLSIFDVTDPADPRLVGAIEGPDHAATWQVQVADGLLVQGMEHRPPAWGGDPALNSAEGIRLLRRQRSGRAEAASASGTPVSTACTATTSPVAATCT